MATNKATQFEHPVSQAMVDAARTITHLSIWRDAARTAATRIGIIQITASATVELGQTVTLPAGIITFTVPTPSNGTAYAATEAVKGMHGSAIYIDAHHAAPGNAGTQNRLSDLGQATLTSSNWTYS